MILLKDSLSFTSRYYAYILDVNEFSNLRVSDWLAKHTTQDILLKIYNPEVTRETFKSRDKTQYPSPLYQIYPTTDTQDRADLWQITSLECGTQHDVVEFPKRLLNLEHAGDLSYEGFTTTKSEWIKDLIGVVFTKDPEIIRKIALESGERYSSYFTGRRK